MIVHVVEGLVAGFAFAGVVFALVRSRGEEPRAVDEPVVRERQFF